MENLPSLDLRAGRTTTSQLLNADDLSWLTRQVDGARTEAAVLDDRVLRSGITMWEMEQLMRQDILNAYQNGNIEEIEAEQSFEGKSVKVSLLQSYSELAHSTWNEEREEFDIHPYYDLMPLLERSKAWVRERLEKNDWKIAQCEMGKRRRFISDSVYGLECAINQIGWTIRYETRLQQPEIMNSQGQFMEINDRVEALMREIIGGMFCFAKPGKDKPKAVPARWSNASWNQVFNAYLVDREVDSFIDWMSVLPKWDKQPRLDHWITEASLIPTDESNPLVTQWVARTILQVAVMRAYHPAEKHDTIPVLIGPQGCGKSTAVSHLLPTQHRSRWFCDSLVLSDSDKKRIESLQGAVLVEISEMTGATTHEIESIKAFLSRTDDRVRLSYRKNPENAPRLVSMVGTANGSAILPNDPTGNRRFIALNLKSGNPAKVRDYLEQHRTQLWAEAKYRITEQGEQCYFPPELEAAQRNANETVRSADTVLEDAISDYLIERHHAGVSSFVLTDIILDLKLSGADAPETLSFQDQKRITRVLERYGMKKIRPQVNGVRKRYWAYPENFTDVINHLAPAKHES